VIIDDPHNVREAESEAVRTSTVEWFREAIPSRVNDVSRDAFVVIQQRVHYDDVAQAAIEMGYEHLNVPAHFDESKPSTTSIGWRDPRTVDGENFWPERFPDEFLDQLAEDLGPYAFAAQYEQSPTPREGGLFKVGNLRFIPDVPLDEEIIWADGWDLAGSDEKENRASAYTARVRLGWRVKAQRVVIAFADRRRLSPGAVEKWIDEIADITPKNVTLILPQDPGQAGKAQKARLSQLLAGTTFRFELQSGDKETRATPLAAQIENGNVDLVRGPWNKDFVEELRQFPRGKFKDQVDAAASAFNAVAPRRNRQKPLGAASSTVTNRARAT
jgi:predicted phage terminase large subunit-like protein